MSDDWQRAAARRIVREATDGELAEVYPLLLEAMQAQATHTRAEVLAEVEKALHYVADHSYWVQGGKTVIRRCLDKVAVLRQPAQETDK